MLTCRIRVGGYDKNMRLRARACDKRASHSAGGYPICEQHTQRMADAVIYTIHPDGPKLSHAMNLQKLAA